MERWRGLMTMVHIVTDGFGNLLYFILFGGNCNDIGTAQALLESYNLTDRLDFSRIKDMTAMSSSNGLRDGAGLSSFPAVSLIDIPGRQTGIYKECHLIEKPFLRLKDNPRFVTRYEKKEVYFRAVTYPICILVWLL